MSPEVEDTIKKICQGFKYRYHIDIKQIGFDQDHLHFYLQFLPKYSGGKVIRIIKSVTAQQIFKQHPEVKKQLWGGEFWTDGYYMGTVSPKEVIINYIRKQGRDKDLKQLKLFNL